MCGFFRNCFKNDFYLRKEKLIYLPTPIFFLFFLNNFYLMGAISLGMDVYRDVHGLGHISFSGALEPRLSKCLTNHNAEFPSCAF